ncbi:hypothetical protein [Hymenobacter sp.]|uniref:hypothetical protein n=1 Tax=Hymenobacter sp. TaxID=1898978 RepID=UPI00286CD28F|nr:hypothetical protein [Hymenobacter sp.]
MDLLPLYQTLDQRRRPEDIAELLLPLLRDQLTPRELATLSEAAAGSVRRGIWQYTSMAEDFARPMGGPKQALKAAELFQHSLPAASAEAPGPNYSDPAQLQQLLEELSPRIGKTPGQNNYLADRLARPARRAAGLEGLSRRRYNKLFRILRHLEAKRQRLLQAGQQRGFQLVSKHGFAHEISYADFARDLFSAAFVAYYTARCNLRSEFTIAGQQRPYDAVSDLLFRRCRDGQPPRPVLLRWRTKAPPLPPPTTTNWWAIAHVYPQPEVLARLPGEQQGQLLGRWTALLNELADFLRQTWAANTFRRESMVVKRGDDSSTWNVAAGAWNKARDNWVNLLYALGMDFVLDDVCPGKVMRLMAADVVAWHLNTGGKLDPNTQVWAALPFPWEVLSGAADCTKPLVAEACRHAGLDPATSGWLAPRPHGVVPFRPTPELVHGVSIASPYLARVLRRNRVFSGKPAPDSPLKAPPIG